MDEKSMDEKSPLFKFPVGGRRGQWLQMTSAVHVCRFMSQSLDIIPYVEVDWSATPVESNKHYFTLFLFVANPRSLTPLDDALPFI